MEPNRLAIVIPAYNEEGAIGDVITELKCVLKDTLPIVVVNDCSSDQTSKIAQQHGAIVVDLNVNHGYSKAIEKGLDFVVAELEVDYILTMDADGQHDPLSIKNLLESDFLGDCDLVVGQRNETARFAEKLFSLYFSFRFDISDPLCGLKVYRRDLYSEFDKFETYDSIGTEILTSSLLKGKVVKEFPINIRDRFNGNPRFGGAFKANKRILFSLINTMLKFGK